MEAVNLLNEDQIIAQWCADLYDQNLFETDEDVQFLAGLSEACARPGRVVSVCMLTIAGLVSIWKEVIKKLLVTLAMEEMVMKAAKAPFALDGEGFQLLGFAAPSHASKNNVVPVRVS